MNRTRPQQRNTASPGLALGQIPGGAPIAVAASATIREALATMDRQRVDSLVIVSADRRPEGILSLRDVLRRVALAAADLSAPVASVMTRQAESLPDSASACEGLLYMVRRKMLYLPVVNDAGELVRLASLSQLQDPFVGAIDFLTGRIDAAATIDELAHCADDSRRLAVELLAGNGDSGLLTSMLTGLNDHLSRRVIELAVEAFGSPPAPWCWIVMGSEGRFEQTLHTDQDNGLIFDGSAAETESIRQWFLPMAQQVNAYLDRCGIPHCTGGIMAGNPECCLSLEEWQRRFHDWIAKPEPQALLKATIFFDYRPLYGDLSLAQALRRHLQVITRDQAPFLRFLTSNALAATPPIGFVREFITESGEGGTRAIDLKKFGSRLFVDAARIFGLAAGAAETSTVGRLRDAGPVNGIHANDIDSAVRAFTELQRIRIANQVRALASGQADGNLLDPKAINSLDRKILRESFKQAQRLQLHLRQAYAL